MKLVTVKFDDSVDINGLIIGATASVSDGTTTVANGEIMAKTEMLEPELIPHVHSADTSVGLPEPPPTP